MAEPFILSKWLNPAPSKRREYLRSLASGWFDPRLEYLCSAEARRRAAEMARGERCTVRDLLDGVFLGSKISPEI
jgi:hypothetical protein